MHHRFLTKCFGSYHDISGYVMGPCLCMLIKWMGLKNHSEFPLLHVSIRLALTWVNLLYIFYFLVYPFPFVYFHFSSVLLILIWRVAVNPSTDVSIIFHAFDSTEFRQNLQIIQIIRICNHPVPMIHAFTFVHYFEQ